MASIDFNIFNIHCKLSKKYGRVHGRMHPVRLNAGGRLWWPAGLLLVLDMNYTQTGHEDKCSSWDVRTSGVNGELCSWATTWHRKHSPRPIRHNIGSFAKAWKVHEKSSEDKWRARFQNLRAYIQRPNMY